MFDGVVIALNDVCENVESPAMSRVEIKTDIKIRVSWQGKEGSLQGILGGSMDPYVSFPHLREGAAYIK